jgi:hypothetical protein
MTAQQNLADQFLNISKSLPGPASDPLRRQAIAAIQRFEAAPWIPAAFDHAKSVADLRFDSADPFKLAPVPASGRHYAVCGIIRLLDRYTELING